MSTWIEWSEGNLIPNSNFYRYETYQISYQTL